MTCQLILSAFIAFLCLSIYPRTVSSIDLTGMYPWDTSNCEFPFNYLGKTYNNCTTDGDNGNTPWCSITTDYVGQFVQCYDFSKPLIKCLDKYIVNGREFTGCAFLSRSAKYKQCKTDNDDFPYLYCPDAKKEDKSKYPKRRRQCENKYSGISKTHTKCFQPSPFAVNIEITEDEKQELLDMHDQYRAAVPSEHMFKLYWNDKLADMARARGELCVFDHDLSDNRIIPEFGWKNGQNLVWTTEIRSSLASLIDDMLGAEKERFIYGQGCTSPGSCLHYTQTMVSNITHVGCSHTQCVYNTHIDRFLTCNYIQSQYANKYTTPYVESSKSAVKCPSKAKDGLCDCGDKICRYGKGEYLEPNTCECKGGISKRSLNKRAVDEEVIIAAPSGASGHLLDKRSINVLKRISKKKVKN